MARFKKKENPVEAVDVSKKVMPIEKYYALYSNYHFMYPVVIKNGKSGKVENAMQTHPTTGNILFDVTGAPKLIMKSERFHTIENKMSKGFLSFAEFNPNTDDPQELARGEALRALAKQDDIHVLDENAYDRQANRDAWIEKQRRKDLEEKLAVAESRAARADELEKQIAELEAKT